MMHVVRCHPSGVAEAQRQIGVKNAHQVILPASAEDLEMPGIVNDEAHLREDKREEHRVACLQPRILCHSQKRQPAAKER